MQYRHWLKSTTVLSGVVGAVLLSTMSARAQSSTPDLIFGRSNAATSLPAVDGFNGKGEVLGGLIGHKSIVGGRGAVSVPLSGQYGLQIDLQAGSLGGDPFGGVAAHWFWRDPGRGLLGLYAGHTRWDRFGGVNVTHVGGEAEYYWQRWTLQGIAGVEFGNSTSFTATSAGFVPQIGTSPGVATTFFEAYDVRTRFFDQINLKYYLMDNWAAYIGHRYMGGQNAFAVGSEWAVPVGGGRLVSAFVEGRAGSGEFQGVWGGVKAYFGQKDKTLMQRHRQDDPGYLDSLFSMVNSLVKSSSSSQFCTTGTLRNGVC